MSKEDKVFQEIKAEQDDGYTDDSLYNINSWGADLSFRELIDRYEDDELVKPEIQRNYVWDKTEASRFIDSILFGLPIPSIFLAKTDDEKMLIVDGFQRIMTVYDYVRGIFSTDGKVFRLTNSKKINHRWRGKAFSELSDVEQRKIKNTTIHTIIFVQVHPAGDDTSMYQIFERINTSGKTLLPQEIRNCVYQGPFNTLLMELNTYPVWRTLYGLETPDSRMRDIEFILRFLMMDSKDFRAETISSISLRKYLNMYMKEYCKSSAEVLNAQKQIFIETLGTVQNLFGNEVFHNISPKYPDRLVPKFNPTIFDSIMLAASFMIKNALSFPKHDYNAKRWHLLLDETYQNAISIRTTNISQIKSRISLVLRYLFDVSYE